MVHFRVLTTPFYLPTFALGRVAVCEGIKAQNKGKIDGKETLRYFWGTRITLLSSYWNTRNHGVLRNQQYSFTLGDITRLSLGLHL